MCFLVPGFKVILTDKRAAGAGGTGSEPEEFVSRGGLADYVDFLSVGENITEVITHHRQSGTFEEKVPVDGKMQTRDARLPSRRRLALGQGLRQHRADLRQHHPHLAGRYPPRRFRTSARLRRQRRPARSGSASWPRWPRRATIGRRKKTYKRAWWRSLKVTLPEPQFRGQTKQELGTPAVQTIAYDVVKQGLADWIKPGGGPRTHVNALRDKIASAVVNRVTSKQALDARRNASSLGSTGMPDKLADCRVHGGDSELIIVEGDSAAGPAKTGRDAEHIAILPLRGKVVNAGKSTMKQVLDNAEAQALFTAIGAGSGKDFNLEDARYGRIVILCDADVDGSHIRCLLLTLFYHYMRPMLEAGMVYAAQPPLFTVKVGDDIHRAFNDAEKERITKELTKGNRKAESLRWQRFKGLGEMNVEELAECALDPGSRILRRLTMRRR